MSYLNNITEKLAILCLDNQTGKNKFNFIAYAGYYFTMAMVFDLIILEKLAYKKDEFEILNEKPTEIEYLDNLLHFILKNKNGNNLWDILIKYYWVNNFRIEDIYKYLAENKRVGIKTTVSKIPFATVEKNEFIITDLSSKQNIIEEMRAEVLENTEVNNSTLGLTLLLSTFGLKESYVRNFFSDYENKRMQERLNILLKKNDSEISKNLIYTNNCFVNKPLQTLNAAYGPKSLKHYGFSFISTMVLLVSTGAISYPVFYSLGSRNTNLIVILYQIYGIFALSLVLIGSIFYSYKPNLKLTISSKNIEIIKYILIVLNTLSTFLISSSIF